MKRHTKAVIKLTVGLCLGLVTGVMLLVILLGLTTPVWYRTWPFALVVVIGVLLGPLLLRSVGVKVRRFLIVLGWSFGVWSLFVPIVELFDHQALTWKGPTFAVLGIVAILFSWTGERTELKRDTKS